MMWRLSLSGSDWQIKAFVGHDWLRNRVELQEHPDMTFGWLPATVPGSVHADLAADGQLPDIHYHCNTLAAEWVSQRCWAYKKVFRVDPGWKGRRIRLQFDGVDDEATFFLNGVKIGHHKGMFTPARFEVAEQLNYDGDNTLFAVLEPAPENEPQTGFTSRVTHSKTRMNYWWDFAPRLVHIGLWDHVFLEASGPVRIEDIFVQPKLKNGFQQASIPVSLALSTARAILAAVQLALYQGENLISTHQFTYSLTSGENTVNATLTLDNPLLWWPNGYGDPNLYELHVTVSTGEGAQLQESHRQKVTFGIRQVRLASNPTPHQPPLAYTYEVNGQKMYIKGWNWVPMDLLYGMERPEKLERLFELARRAGVNMLRVWGGGLIEREDFYTLADRYGIMLRQDFIQSSSYNDCTPSTDPDYVDRMQAEAAHIIRRKRNHPSLVLWTGGNELTNMDGSLNIENQPVIQALHQQVRKLDPDRLWLPSTPTGRFFSQSLETLEQDPLGFHDTHGPWYFQGPEKHYALYNKGTSLFNSEFGTEGMGHLKVIQATIPPELQWPANRENPAWAHRGVVPNNTAQLQEVFGNAIGDLPALQRASQWLQAEGLRYAVESNMRRWPQNSGSMPWQYNEPFPNAYCWSAVDYYTRPKAAYYAVARAYAPVSVTARLPRMTWAGQSHFEAGIWGVSTGPNPVGKATLQVLVLGSSGRIIFEERCPATLPAATSNKLMDLSVPVGDIPDAIFLLDIRLLDGTGRILAQNQYTGSCTSNFAPLLSLEKAVVQARMDMHGNQATVTLVNSGPGIAYDLWLDDDRDLNAPGCCYFDENLVTLLPGEEKTVNISWHQVPAGQRTVKLSGWNLDECILQG